MSDKIYSSKLREYDVLIRCYSVPLLLGIFAAIIHGNVSPSSHHTVFESTIIAITDNFSITFEFLINEVFMVYFFGFVMKRVIQSLTPPNGNMYPFKRAIPPIISSFCGMLMPICFFLIFIAIMDEASSKYSFDTLSNGMAIPMSTDVALSYTVATFIFNEHLDVNATNATLHEIHPCISFLLLLAICDDIIGLIIIAIFYKTDDEIEFNLLWLLVTLGAMILAFISNKYMKIYYWWYYIFIIGTMSWFGILLSGIHPAVALIPIMPFMVIYKGRRERAESESSNLLRKISISVTHGIYSLDMLNKFETIIDRFVEYGLFFFTYCNAAVQFNDFGGMTVCVFASLLIGKIIGISFGSYFVNKLCYVPLPAHMKLRHLPLVGFCGAIGLIVSLFIADIAWDDNQLIDQSKMGVLCGAIFAIVVALLYRFIRKRKPIWLMKQMFEQSVAEIPSVTDETSKGKQASDAEMTQSFQ